MLLSLKLGIESGRRGVRRTKDCQDIINLLGILEKDGCEPSEVYNDLSCEQYNKLRKIFSSDCNECGECRAYSNPGLLVIPNEDYVHEVIKCGEEDEDENISVV